MPRNPEIVFRLGLRSLGLPLRQVREVLLPGGLTRIPHASAAVAGAMNVRGRVVLVVDAGTLLGGEPSRRGDASERILMLDQRRRDLGLWVSEVLQIAQLGDDPDAAPPAREQLLDADVLAEQVARLFGVDPLERLEPV